MSILTSFKKLLDPDTERMEEQLRKQERERPRKAAEGDGPGYVCRICGHEAEDKGFCPACLADTMEPRKRK
jgi:rubrerythrin